MTLGQRISQHRKALGISQEELGGRLGVSRQAVSKWETDAAAPDMNNLIALAREFGVSVAELTETPEKNLTPENMADAALIPISHRPRHLLWPALCGCLAVLTIVLLVFLTQSHPSIKPPEESQTVPTPIPASDFVLIWINEDGNEEFLELGEQAERFPFGTTLEADRPETVTDSGFPNDTYHDLSCGSLSLRYSTCSEQPDDREVIILRMLETASRNYRTPRNIGVGSTEAEVIQAYGEANLIYCDGTYGPGTILPYENYYVYCPFDTNDPGFGCNLIFLLSGRHVTGLRLEDASYPYYHVNNTDSFPVKDGAPDFSARQERPLTTEQQVYDALNALVIRQDLTAEELYAYRWIIFSSLSDLDWWAFGDLGATEHRDETISALLTWLREQAPYSEAEIFRLQMGVQSNLDGWLSESYAHLLSTAFFGNPIAFVKGLAYDGLEDIMHDAVHLTAYDAELYPMELQTALDTLDVALDGETFTEAEAGWARLLRLYLTTGIDEQYKLPKTPAEMA